MYSHYLLFTGFPRLKSSLESPCFPEELVVMCGTSCEFGHEMEIKCGENQTILQTVSGTKNQSVTNYNSKQRYYVNRC